MKKIHLTITLLLVCMLFLAGCKKEKEKEQEKAKIIVTYKPNGGKGSMPIQQFVANTPQALLPNVFERFGYFFTEWNTAADGTAKQFSEQEIIEITSSMTLHAQWESYYDGGKPCPDTPTLVDIDGNIYNTVQIGSQCWMRENLRTTKLKNGETIPVIPSFYDWTFAEIPAMCYYDNNKEFAQNYGALYNGYAAMSGKLCPEGWHVPEYLDWGAITGYLGWFYLAGREMKTVFGWAEGGNGSNESGFSGFPAGIRSVYDDYCELGKKAIFWGSNGKEFRMLSYDEDSFMPSGTPVMSGYSVRCIKD